VRHSKVFISEFGKVPRDPQVKARSLIAISPPDAAISANSGSSILLRLGNVNPPLLSDGGD
jgi:hypothetical protein